MVIAATIALALAQQATSGQAAATLNCAFATPGSEVVEFVAANWAENGTEIRIVGAEGSVWPRTALFGRRGVLTGAPGAARMFAFGSGNGLALEVAPTSGQEVRSATLYRRGGRKIGLPLAFGFCAVRPGSLVYRMQDPIGDPAEIGADIPAFDPARWPAAGCGLVLSDGRRVPFHLSFPNRDQVRLASPVLWPEGPVTMAMRWFAGARGQTGSFARSGGPSGRAATAVSMPWGARLIRLWQIGPAAPGLTGFGICGRQLVRSADR